ncbi:GNAT family N-acetyltransferase [soil metagenome]|jgi:ribosomal-protein-alanine N-acetyltransferase
MKIIAQTPRLLIREFAADEEELLLAIDADERLIRYVKKRGPEESRRLFRESLKDYGNGTGLGRWGVFNQADGDFIGLCMLKPSESDASCIELGYRLHLKYWGIGIATELSKALVFYGFKEIGLPAITAVTHPQNAVSQRVLEKAGLIRQGTAFWYGEDLPFFKIEAREEGER